MKIEYWDRYLKRIKEDKIYADDFILWCYETPMGNKFLDKFFSKKLFNQIYGIYKRSPFSVSQIKKDIRKYDIKIDLFKPQHYSSYEDFFLREFIGGIRDFPKDQTEMGAFGEGRFLGFEKVTQDHKYPVKGHFLNSLELLNHHPIAKEFEDGPLLICRLCPIDYHHFHFPDDGDIIEQFRIHGDYESVNLHALRNRPHIFIKNERDVSILQTKNFGLLAFIEVGAMCVGKIIHNKKGLIRFGRGEQKGHFKFGASTIIVLGQAGKWKPSLDILEHSMVNRESYIKLGDKVAKTI